MSFAPALTLLFAASLSAQTLSPTESAIARAVDAENPAALSYFEKIVNINSGTMNLPGVIAVKDTIAPQLESVGFKVLWTPMQQIDARAGDLVATHPCPAGAGKCGKRLLLIGHMDTVFEPSSSFQRYSIVPNTDGKIATGPGVNDMKGGLVVMLSALKAMQAANALAQTEITIVLSGDEESHGDPTSVSRQRMIEAAHHADIAFEFENASRIKGQDMIRSSRRSSLSWKVETTGISGHSSQIFNDHFGDGAIYELTRILDQFHTQLTEHGLTYNVGLLLGGATALEDATHTGGTATGKTNVIPPVAFAKGDLRTLSNDQTEHTEAKMRAIVADHLPRTGATITFAEGYPAMAETEAAHKLVTQLNEVNTSLGLPPQQIMDPMLGGAGDIAFIAPFIPGLVALEPWAKEPTLKAKPSTSTPSPPRPNAWLFLCIASHGNPETYADEKAAQTLTTLKPGMRSKCLTLSVQTSKPRCSAVAPITRSSNAIVFPTAACSPSIRPASCAISNVT